MMILALIGALASPFVFGYIQANVKERNYRPFTISELSS